MKKIFLIVLLLFLAGFLPTDAVAHPGRTDAKGGHVCRTNCDKWGVALNQWHSHNGTLKAKQAKATAKTVSRTKGKSVNKNMK